jgi:hypothetical protein
MAAAATVTTGANPVTGLSLQRSKRATILAFEQAHRLHIGGDDLARHPMPARLKNN